MIKVCATLSWVMWIICLATLGCHQPETIEICTVSGRGMTLQGATLSRGEVLAFRLIPVDSDGKARKDRHVSLTAGDSSILGVSPLDFSGEVCRGPGDRRWYYVIFGRERGETTLHIRVDGEPILTVPAEVH